MSVIHCHRCGCRLPEGSLKYQVAVRVRSLFDGVISESREEGGEQDLRRLMQEVAAYSEEDLNRQVYEDDVFILCLECKEAFLDDIYSHLHPKATPESGRAHLIH
jgi:tryptophanyl-tRNA synthetase